MAPCGESGTPSLLHHLQLPTIPPEAFSSPSQIKKLTQRVCSRSHSKQLAKSVFVPSFVCHQSLSFPHCVCRNTEFTICLLQKTLLSLIPSFLSSLFCPVPLGHESRQQPPVKQSVLGRPGQDWAEPSVVRPPRFRVGLVSTQLTLLLWAVMAEMQSLNFNYEEKRFIISCHSSLFPNYAHFMIK